MRVLEHITRIYNKNDVPRWCGVYMIITKSGKRYIGSSENLKKRYSLETVAEKIKTKK